VPEAALRIAILGAESTGKTTLASDLALALSARTGQAVPWVPEWLREWCDAHGRTPTLDEQPAIAQGQFERISAKSAAHAFVVCDTTPLMTAVYSRLVFGDRSLDAKALEWQRQFDITLLMALDLPWVADGLQRDGPQVQQPVDRMLRELLAQVPRPWFVIGGQGSERLRAALAAIDAARPARATTAPPKAPAAGRAAA
jgi:nicotinamide riboside kinase